MLTPRLSPLWLAFAGSALLAAGCLPAAYEGPSQAMPDLADVVPDDAPPIGDPSPPPPPADLAGSVVIDAFTTSGTAMMQLSETTSTLRLNESKDVTVTISNVSGTGMLALVNAPPGFTA